MIVHDDTNIGTTGCHAPRDIVRTLNILWFFYGSISRNEEAPARSKP
ncbi:MAG: hypothetical protein BAJALOKI1v1_910012 [Promethearchaeota archaeon]|nr:MAG: hypothetical protein BAJALOKI1v1_910012 [Candidatus Lokiarchaeota archaeon]